MPVHKCVTHLRWSPPACRVQSTELQHSVVFQHLQQQISHVTKRFHVSWCYVIINVQTLIWHFLLSSLIHRVYLHVEWISDDVQFVHCLISCCSNTVAESVPSVSFKSLWHGTMTAEERPPSICNGQQLSQSHLWKGLDVTDSLQWECSVCVSHMVKNKNIIGSRTLALLLVAGPNGPKHPRLQL